MTGQLARGHGFLLSIICALISKQDSAGERAQKIFRELDINGDGELDEDEFVKGCLDDGDLMRLLNAGGLERTGSEEGNWWLQC